MKCKDWTGAFRRAKARALGRARIGALGIARLANWKGQGLEYW